jgi:hypothetical protein
VIVFGTASTGIWRVAAAGGPLTEVTRIDRSRQEVFHDGPDFLPDGRHFLYRSFGPDQDHTGIYVGSLDAKPEQQNSKPLVTTGSSAVFAPATGPDSSSGYVLFTREGSLMVQAFDLRRLALAGEAVPIAQGMGFGASRPFSVSMTGALAFRQVSSVERPTERSRNTSSIGRERAGTAGEPAQHNSVAFVRRNPRRG